MKLFLPFLLAACMLFACKKEKFDPDEQLSEDKAIIRQYCADHGLTPDSTASGLFYVIANEGTGTRPGDSSIVVTNYLGYLTTDVNFDTNNYENPDTFYLPNLIQGWKEGLKLIRTTGRIKILLPSALGYGITGFGTIPGNTVIIFDFELVDHY